MSVPPIKHNAFLETPPPINIALGVRISTNQLGGGAPTFKIVIFTDCGWT